LRQRCQQFCPKSAHSLRLVDQSFGFRASAHRRFSAFTFLKQRPNRQRDTGQRACRPHPRQGSSPPIRTKARSQTLIDRLIENILDFFSHHVEIGPQPRTNGRHFRIGRFRPNGKRFSSQHARKRDVGMPKGFGQRLGFRRLQIIERQTAFACASHIPSQRLAQVPQKRRNLMLVLHDRTNYPLNVGRRDRLDPRPQPTTYVSSKTDRRKTDARLQSRMRNGQKPGRGRTDVSSGR